MEVERENLKDFGAFMFTTMIGNISQYHGILLICDPPIQALHTFEPNSEGRR